MTDALIVLILTSISCSLLGIFLILRKLSMMTDAISHSVLLGIVLAFFLVRDLDSPLSNIRGKPYGPSDCVFDRIYWQAQTCQAR